MLTPLPDWAERGTREREERRGKELYIPAHTVELAARAERRETYSVYALSTL